MKTNPGNLCNFDRGEPVSQKLAEGREIIIS
jgi:hypothetical protein